MAPVIHGTPLLQRSLYLEVWWETQRWKALHRLCSVQDLVLQSISLRTGCAAIAYAVLTVGACAAGRADVQVASGGEQRAALFSLECVPHPVGFLEHWDVLWVLVVGQADDAGFAVAGAKRVGGCRLQLQPEHMLRETCVG